MSQTQQTQQVQPINEEMPDAAETAAPEADTDATDAADTAPSDNADTVDRAECRHSRSSRHQSNSGSADTAERADDLLCTTSVSAASAASAVSVVSGKCTAFTCVHFKWDLYGRHSQRGRYQSEAGGTHSRPTRALSQPTKTAVTATRRKTFVDDRCDSGSSTDKRDTENTTHQPVEQSLKSDAAVEQGTSRTATADNGHKRYRTNRRHPDRMGVGHHVQVWKRRQRTNGVQPGASSQGRSVAQNRSEC